MSWSAELVVKRHDVRVAPKSNTDNQKRRLSVDIVRSPRGVKLRNIGEVYLASEQRSP